MYIYALEQVISIIGKKFSDSIDFTFPSQFVGFETIKYLMFYSSSCVLIQKNLLWFVQERFLVTTGETSRI